MARTSIVHWRHTRHAAAAHLLQRWGPIDAETGEAAFRFAAVSGIAPPPEEDPWTTAPGPDDVAGYGAFPETFTGAGRAGHRHPVRVQSLNQARRPGPNEPWRAAREPDAVAHEAGLLLTSLLNSGPEKLGEPAEELLAELIGQMFLRSSMYDWLRVTVAARPDGPALDDEVHLVGRDLSGDTFRLSVAAAASLPELHKAGRWPDPARLLTRRTDPPRTLTGQQYRHADLGVRAACAANVLGEYVWLTNNDRMNIGVRVEPHGLSLDCASPDEADEAFRASWPGSAACADLLGEELWEDEEITHPRRLDEETLAAFLTDFEEHNLGLARSGAQAMGQIDDNGPDDGPPPRFPGDRLVPLLGRDLFNIVIHQVMGGLAEVPPLAYGIGVPFEVDPEDGGFYACLLLAGPALLGMVSIDAMP